MVAGRNTRTGVALGLLQEYKNICTVSRQNIPKFVQTKFKPLLPYLLKYYKGEASNNYYYYLVAPF